MYNIALGEEVRVVLDVRRHSLGCAQYNILSLALSHVDKSDTHKIITNCKCVINLLFNIPVPPSSFLWLLQHAFGLWGGIPRKNTEPATYPMLGHGSQRINNCVMTLTTSFLFHFEIN
jgi:hypothetical protein